MGVKRIIASVLVVILLISCNACTEPSPVIGTWVGELDYSQILQEEFSKEELWNDVQFQNICLDISFEFREDGSFTMEILKDSADAMVQSLLDLATDCLLKNMEQRGESMESLGLTRDVLQAKMREQIDISTLTDPLEFAFGSGYYVYRDSCIYIGSQPGSLRADPEQNAAEILRVTLGDGTILVDGFGSHEIENQGFLPGLIPFKLVKQ